MFSLRTINYGSPPAGHFWQWSADHDAVEWYDGQTLAMWGELHGLLNFLGEDGGLPPLGAILLLLAACRDEWLGLCIPLHEKVMRILNAGDSDSVPPEIKDTLVRGLKVVNDLPKDLRSSLAAKCLLISSLFAGGPYSLPREESTLILRELSIHGSKPFHGVAPEMDARTRFFRDLRALRTGLARHDGTSLESLLRTGLENLTILAAPVPAHEPGTHDSRNLLDRLATLGGEGGAAAAVARRAIAMMNFPGSFGAPRDLPMGGISDITNRGTVDRLLPGELAWDDLVLAARLVHNEALYFRREIPPLHVAVSHTILLDRGLRLWGTGRIFALGVALGLRHHPAVGGPHESFECLAASQEGFTTIDLATPAGVHAALQTLVPAAGPDHFLTAWWEGAAEADEATVTDLSFITAKEHLEVAATRNLLGNIAAWIHGRSGRFRVLALGRSGDVSVQDWSPGGIRESFKGEIDLDEVLPNPKAPRIPDLMQPPLRAKPDPLHTLLPIYALDRLPFLFPVIPQGSAMLHLLPLQAEGADVIGVSQGRRLMEWPKKGWGARELVAEVPGRQHWMAHDDRSELIVIASGSTPGESVRVFRYHDGRLMNIEIVASKHAFPQYATVCGDAVLLAYSDHVEAISLTSGNRVAVLPVGKLPTSPLLDFDGEQIRVHDSGAKPGASLDGWPFGDATWPRLFFPDRIAFSGGVLLVSRAEMVYLFYPMELCWRLVSSSSALFVEFEESDLPSATGMGLELARFEGGYEAWLDSRGLLHLRNSTMEGHSSWSILLTTSKTAVWNESWGLCAFEERLRFPTESEPGDLPLRALTQFLHAKSPA